jgi:membrane protease subunit (stomatin/prohibitin family)
MNEKKIGILKISSYLSEFSEIIYDKLFTHFEEFGLVLDNFSFHNINAPDEDLNALNEMKIQRKRNQLEAEGAAAKMDIESAARARMREREGYTYQQEEAFKTMQTAAANEGTSGNIMGAGMGLGMGFGIGGAMNGAMCNMAQITMGSTNMMQQPSASKMVNCSACGKPNPEGAKFCLECGGAISSGPKCPSCGEAIIPGAKFCLACGASLQTQVTNCPNCGKDIVPGAKFCLECGTKI